MSQFFVSANDDRPKDYDGLLVGTSLRYCVASMIERDIPYEKVAFVITSTAIQNQDDLEFVIREYELNWELDFEKASDIARKLWKDGKLYQPRLAGQNPPYGKDKFCIWHTEQDGGELLRRLIGD